MEKKYRMMVTLGSKFLDNNLRLRLDNGHHWLPQNNVEVKANINLENGEVTLFIDDDDLEKLRADNQEKFNEPQNGANPGHLS